MELGVNISIYESLFQIQFEGSIRERERERERERVREREKKQQHLRLHSFILVYFPRWISSDEGRKRLVGDAVNYIIINERVGYLSEENEQGRQTPSRDNSSQHSKGH